VLWLSDLTRNVTDKLTAPLSNIAAIRQTVQTPAMTLGTGYCRIEESDHANISVRVTSRPRADSERPTISQGQIRDYCVRVLTCHSLQIQSEPSDDSARLPPETFGPFRSRILANSLITGHSNNLRIWMTHCTRLSDLHMIQ
jgi:hypothetical protein